MRAWISKMGLLVFCCIFLLTIVSCKSDKLVPTEDQRIESENKLVIDTKNKGLKISDVLYGAFFEDINNGADNGLYAEMIRNRSFEFEQGFTGWSEYYCGDGIVRLEVQKVNSINEQNPSYAHLMIDQVGESAGISNAGLSDLSFEENNVYHFSAYMRSLDNSVAQVKVLIYDYQDQEIASNIVNVENAWQKVVVDLTATMSSKAAKLALVVADVGELDVDMVSLFPENTYKERENGLRNDIASLIAEMNPSFFRFPGGCIVEGTSMENAYRWKDTIGTVENRPINENLWGYYQSYGLGFYEYFQYCEDMGTEPLPVINVGMACQARNGNMVGLLELDPYIQDALDLIEYANGDIGSQWGAVRAASGHKEPFNMKYLAVGNEQWGPDYYKRYELFYDAIKAVYPEMKIIFAAGPLASGNIFDEAWQYIQNGKADLVDEHYYMSPTWFFNNVNRYDDYDRKGPKVFVGEYAAHDGGKKNSILSALAEAAFMTGLEKNSDVVEMASYAPLLSFSGHSQWNPDLIWFKQDTVYATPNYYVQQMFSQNRGEYVLPSVLTTASAEITESSINGAIGLGSWATSVEYQEIKVTSNDGTVLYQSEENENLDQWKGGNGNWTSIGTGIMQSDLTENCFLYTGDNQWSNYTLSMKAKKNSGNEGFLIMFGVKDNQNFYWWNLGGWNNTVTAIEKATNGSKTTIGSSNQMRIDSGKWYDIKVVVEGESFKCYLDGILIHEVEDKQSYDPLYATSSMASNGDIIIKVVNASEKEQTISIQLEGVADAKLSGEVVVLSGKSIGSENSFNNPENVVPVKLVIETVGEDFDYIFKPFSVTVIRLLKASKAGLGI